MEQNNLIIKMQKKITIEGLEKRRYVAKTANIGSVYCVIMIIETKKDFIWVSLYSKCYALVRKHDPNSQYIETKKAIVEKLGFKINDFIFTPFKHFDVDETLKTLEEDYVEFYERVEDEKSYKESIKDSIKKIEDRLMFITTIEYQEPEEEKID